MKNSFLLTILLVLSFSSQAEIERNPSSLFSKEGCRKIISRFFPDPYKKKYPLKEYASFEDAVRAFDARRDANAHNVKIGSQSFKIIKKGPDGKPLKNNDVTVVLHGYSDSPGTMRNPAEFHSWFGQHVLAHRLPDHGLRPELQEEAIKNSKLREWTDSIDETLAMAKAMAGESGKIYIVGYSMGAALAFDATKRHPGLFSGRFLHAPLFKVEGFVPRAAIYLLKIFTSGIFYKKVDETDAFYKGMSYQMTFEMARLLARFRHLLRYKSDDVPTVVFRVDPEHETTVDDDAIDRFIEAYGADQYMYTNPPGIEDPVLHRDFTSRTVNSSGEDNPALDTIYAGLLEFFGEPK